jgi:glycosyltransferase involved in cell wall biosynthesis
MASAMGVGGRMVFTGVIQDVFEAMSACDAIALPSHSEGLPIACLEAMVLGKPQVVSDIDGLGEAIRESQGGFAIPVGDDLELAENLVTILTDSALSRSVGANARRWVIEHCSPEVFRRAFWDGVESFLTGSALSRANSTYV